jgi:hypothetical protein
VPTRFLVCSHARFSHILPGNTTPADPSITNNFESAHLGHQLMVQKYVGTLDIPVDQRFLKCRVEVHNASCCVQTYAETGLPLQCRFLILGAKQVQQKYHYCFSNSVWREGCVHMWGEAMRCLHLAKQIGRHGFWTQPFEAWSSSEQYSETPLVGFSGEQWTWALENITQRKYNTEVTGFGSLKMNVNWEKTLNR